jgi:hypothetical protein
MLNLRHYQNHTKKSLMNEARKYGVYSLLGRIDANPKLAKNAKQNALSVPLHLAPFNLSGHNVCAMATAGCAAACLHSAGNPAYMAQKEKSRIARTKLYFANRALFIEILRREIKLHIARAGKLGMQAAVRLNATSDILFENVTYHLGDRQAQTLFSEFANVQFYDYSKHSKRRKLPANYHLTFSLAENNHLQAIEASNNGLNVAVVFDTKRGQALPESFTIDAGPAGKITAPVIDGDATDYRPSDRPQSFVGLRAKGDAIGDDSGFVHYTNGARWPVCAVKAPAPFEYIGGHWPANQKKARA